MYILNYLHVCKYYSVFIKFMFKFRYVLLKERNMLMTMEEVCKDENEIFPNPERLDKVKDSMNNLESIVRERNRAYHMLETGETGERPGKLVYNCLGKIYIIYVTFIVCGVLKKNLL